jgi:hypothetical protein
MIIERPPRRPAHSLLRKMRVLKPAEINNDVPVSSSQKMERFKF